MRRVSENMVRVARHSLAWLSAAAGLGVAIGGADPAAAAAPNIVVIMTDDQTDADSMTRMPNTETLMVSKGVRFTNSFAVNPVCCASRTSFLTGQYSHNNGVWDNQPGERPGGFQDFKGDNNTIACWTQAAGYRTALIGKYLNGYGKKSHATYVPPCWNTWWGLTTPFRYYDYEVNSNGSLIHFGKQEKDYQEDVVSGVAQTFIKASSQPFFLWITGIAPHEGYPGVNVPVPPKRYRGYFRDLALPRPPNFNESNFADKPSFMQRHIPPMGKDSIALARKSYQRRAETLLAADDMVGAVIGQLQALNLLDNTYVIFTSDNGFFNGQHRLPVGKHLGYEEAVRVPLVIRGPQVPAGETRGEMVSNLDVVATIVNLAQAKPGRTLDGRSLAPLLSSDAPWRTAMLIEGDDVVPMNEDHVYGYYSGVRTAGEKYIEHVNAHEKYVGNEFYDLDADPYEVKSRPRAPKYRPIVRQLRPLLAQLRTCAGDNCWVQTTMPRLRGVPRVGSEIGPVCKLCSRDLSRSLEPSESSSIR